MADSRQCMAETNTTLSSNYPIKLKKKKELPGMCVESRVLKYTFLVLSPRNSNSVGLEWSPGSWIFNADPQMIYMTRYRNTIPHVTHAAHLESGCLQKHSEPEPRLTASRETRNQQSFQVTARPLLSGKMPQSSEAPPGWPSTLFSLLVRHSPKTWHAFLLCTPNVLPAFWWLG